MPTPATGAISALDIRDNITRGTGAVSMAEVRTRFGSSTGPVSFNDLRKAEGFIITKGTYSTPDKIPVTYHGWNSGAPFGSGAFGSVSPSEKYNTIELAANTLLISFESISTLSNSYIGFMDGANGYINYDSTYKANNITKIVAANNIFTFSVASNSSVTVLGYGFSGLTNGTQQHCLVQF